MRNISLTSIHGLVGTGTTMPLMGIGTDISTSESFEIILKTYPPLGSSEHNPGAYFTALEILCAHLLVKMGFRIPEPFWVEIDPQKIPFLTRDLSIVSILRLQPKHVFGSLRLLNKKDIPPAHIFEKQHHTECARLLTADNYIMNADRQSCGPSNLLADSQFLYPIDHGRAFLLAVTQPDLLILPRTHFCAHISYQTLKKSSIDLLPIVESCKNELTSGYLTDLINNCVQILGTDNDIKHVAAYILSKRLDLNGFYTQLNLNIKN